MLYLKNPNNAPATAAAIIATSGCPLKSAMTELAANANTPVDAASPSSPSVRL